MRRGWRSLIGFLTLIAISGFLALPGRVGDAAEDTGKTGDELAPVVSAALRHAEQQALIAGNTALAFELYQALRRRGRNLAFSPYSISLALSMVYSGSRGMTSEEMARTLHWGPFGDRVPRIFGTVNGDLAERRKGSVTEGGQTPELRLANSLWAQEGYAFHHSFLDGLKLNFSTCLQYADFAGAPDASRTTVNRGVSRQTDGKIKELLPPGAISPLARLMVASAITFSGTWAHQFDERSTRESPFQLLDGRQVVVPMMDQITSLPYIETEAVQAVELPYFGNQFSMVVLLPAVGEFEAFASVLTADRVAAILGQLTPQLIRIHMPRLEFSSSLQLTSALRSLGMRRAFALGLADFSGMVDTRELFLGEIYHETLISVDEAGTFAAVSTALPMVGATAPAITLDRPFIFLIRDMETGSILFIGEVVDPSEGRR